MNHRGTARRSRNQILLPLRPLRGERGGVRGADPVTAQPPHPQPLSPKGEGGEKAAHAAKNLADSSTADAAWARTVAIGLLVFLVGGTAQALITRLTRLTAALAE